MTTLARAFSEENVNAAQPSAVAPGQRIVALDVLRGFALLGILVMNIQLFAMPVQFITFNPLAYGDLTGINLAVWSLSHIFADQKFMTIFSPLFGAGILLLADRLEARGTVGARYSLSPQRLAIAVRPGTRLSAVER